MSKFNRAHPLPLSVVGRWVARSLLKSAQKAHSRSHNPSVAPEEKVARKLFPFFFKKGFIADRKKKKKKFFKIVKTKTLCFELDPVNSTVSFVYCKSPWTTCTSVYCKPAHRPQSVPIQVAQTRPRKPKVCALVVAVASTP